MNKENEKEILDYLNEWIRYQPDTGRFFWKKSSTKGTRQSGRETATTKQKGYYLLKINGKVFRAHRLAFLIMTGKLPTIVDHIDRDRSNNKWSNLREVSSSGNSLNRNIDKRNKSNVTGVYFNKRENVFIVTYCNEYLGRSKDFFEAVCLRKSKEKEITSE